MHSDITSIGTRLPQLPEKLIQQGVTLRQQEEGDSSFASRLYASTRQEELAQTGWPDSFKVKFLEDQFRLQQAHYCKYYAGASAGVVEVSGVSAGRLHILQTTGELRIIDIAFLPEYRNRGYGSALIQALFEQALLSDSKVSIHVETNNPARNLYHRLGFRVVGQPDPREIYQFMEWIPVKQAV